VSGPPGRLARFRTLGSALGLGREAAERERWPRERLAAFRRSRLGALVAHASAASPFYRERYGGVLRAEEVDLERLPSISKGEWMEAFDDVVTDARLRLDDVERHLEGVRDDVLHLDEFRVMASSGSTGRRGVYVWNRADWLQALGIFLRDAHVGDRGIRIPRLRIAVVGAPDAKHVSYRFGVSIDCGLYRVLRLRATTPMHQLVDALGRFRPDMLIGFPSLIALLASEQLGGGMRLAPRWVETAGELRTEEMTRAIRDAWGVEPTNTYALSETGCAAWSCQEANALHVCEDACILEPVDAEGRPVPPGQPGERLLVTSLLNNTQPVIRMDVSDQLTLSSTPCSCGRTMAVISDLLGRADDVLELPAAGGGTARLHPIHLRSPLGATRDVVSYQIVQRTDAVEVDVVLASNCESVLVALARRLDEVLRERGIAPVPVRVRAVDAIAREPGVGKLKLVRVEMGPTVRAGPVGV
jgi:phenylacetate-CoA ligase